MTIYSMGIDAGASTIKGALVDIEQGRVVGDVQTVETPPRATAEIVGEAVAQLAELCGAEPDAPIGIGFPAPVTRGHIPFVAHLSPTWVGMNAAKFFEDYLSRPVSILNDADAAGLAELTYSDVVNSAQTIIFLTLGAGVGSALFTEEKLFQNTELGHIRLSDTILDAEMWVAPPVRISENLSIEEWAERLRLYLYTIEELFNPDLFILGGDVSEYFEEFSHLLSTRARVVPATLRNHAGIIGAARYAYTESERVSR